MHAFQKASPECFRGLLFGVPNVFLVHAGVCFAHEGLWQRLRSKALQRELSPPKAFRPQARALMLTWNSLELGTSAAAWKATWDALLLFFIGPRAWAALTEWSAATARRAGASCGDATFGREEHSVVRARICPKLFRGCPREE